MRAATRCTPKTSRATRADRMLELSPLLTAAKAAARSVPAWVRTVRSKPMPVILSHLKDDRSLRNASGSLSMTAMLSPRSSRMWASVDPTRPQPMITMCTTVPPGEQGPSIGAPRQRYALRCKNATHWHPPHRGEIPASRNRPGRCLGVGTAGAYTESMSEPVQDVPVSSPAIEQAVDLARRGVITHLTIRGERVAAIVPESFIDALRAAEDAEDAAEADAAMDEPGDPTPWEQVKAELDL